MYKRIMLLKLIEQASFILMWKSLNVPAVIIFGLFGLFMSMVITKAMPRRSELDIKTFAVTYFKFCPLFCGFAVIKSFAIWNLVSLVSGFYSVLAMIFAFGSTLWAIITFLVSIIYYFAPKDLLNKAIDEVVEELQQ